MSRKKTPQSATSWWVDETVPAADIANVLPSNVDVEAFVAWLGPELGRYRDDINTRAAIPPRSEEVAALRDAVRKIDAAYSTLSKLPPGVVARLSALSLVHARNLGMAPWPELERRLRDDLDTARALMGQAGASLSVPAAKRGRKSAAPRDDLLAAIAEKLRATPMKAGDAQALAARIVGLCGAPTLVDTDSIKAANRRGKKIT